MKKEDLTEYYSATQLFSLTLLRILIGWHFLYEGFVKLLSVPAWTARSYLLGSVGPASPAFRALAENQGLLKICDIMNVWGLILIGLSLFTGFLTRIFIICAMVLLFLYYSAYPPFASLGINVQTEGSYWLVNKNLIEMAALFVLYLFPTSKITGLDYFLIRKKSADLPVH
jgi:thiosulfate dehydrogenase [quinone] large subunit